MRKRRTFSGQFKAQVVLEALTGVKSAAQVCREHDIKGTVLSRWKQEFIERAPELFERRHGQNQQDERVAELERVIGRLMIDSGCVAAGAGSPCAAADSSQRPGRAVCSPCLHGSA